MDRLVSTLLFLVLSVAVASAATVPEDYWHEVLPNTPIPGAIRTLLCPDLLREVRGAPVKTGMRWWYHYAANESQAHNDPDGALFFLEKDLHPNTRKQLQFIRSAPPSPFIPRPVADAIPFSSKKLPELMARFSLQPDSVGAEDMRVSLHGCEHPAGAGEAKSCVTSLESMIDFTTSNLGTRDVRASSTEVGNERQQKQQYYTVAGVEGLQEGGKAVVCHVQPFPYAVFFCHATDSVTRAYKVPLVGEDGSKVTAVAVCHIDTSAWNPRHLAFQVLKVKPGSIPVCHFLRQDVVVWTPTM
ncbi:hypothetical protein Taro_054133 [Colocasia esculenta]|uniref:BURP domain-containing protein n=1 Tax=Colocasia esculenta TaxID=4460 RepID=A0A843XN33_COLES|nr:hypothetical protein [Colocasia esculenta]